MILRREAGCGVLGFALVCLLALSSGRAVALDTFETKVPAVLMDAATGEVIYENQAHARQAPASMVKMMLALIVMEKIKDGSLRLDEEITVSGKSSKIGGSQVYLRQGEVFTLEQLMKAVMIHSANDAAVAIAEHVTGSTESFVDLMNHKAGELGMQDSEFHSVHGLPHGKGQTADMSSPYDMALVARALVQYPKVLEWTATLEEPFRDGKFTLHSTNKLLNRYKGLDGLKTGYIRESGFCITATAARDSSRMIAVVMGAPSNALRSTETTRLLTRGFEMYKSVKLVGAGQPLKTRLAVSKGKSRDIGLRYAGDLAVSVKSNQSSGLNVREELPQSVKAPVYEGDVVGKATAMLGDKALKSVDIVAAETAEKGGFLQSLLR